uniref:PGAM family member 5, mitochondrial serine/threonine protein phosphatase n=1 Tax=Pongo abelii TaxID=9601 RepID=A0A8I5TZR0_PONAB
MGERRLSLRRQDEGGLLASAEDELEGVDATTVHQHQLRPSEVPGALCQPGSSVLVCLPGLLGEVTTAGRTSGALWMWVWGSHPPSESRTNPVRTSLTLNQARTTVSDQRAEEERGIWGRRAGVQAGPLQSQGHTAHLPHQAFPVPRGWLSGEGPHSDPTGSGAG